MAKSNFDSSAKFDPLMTSDGALESWQRGEFVLGLLAGFRDNYKNKLLVQGKQTALLSLGEYLRQVEATEVSRKTDTAGQTDRRAN